MAISIFVGNIFYAWQAHRLAERTGRSDVTAIPFGVNAPTIFIYVSLIMLPVYERTHDSNLAWQAGVFASFLSGVVQTAGAFLHGLAAAAHAARGAALPAGGNSDGVSVPRFHSACFSDSRAWTASHGRDSGDFLLARAIAVSDSRRPRVHRHRSGARGASCGGRTCITCRM